MAIGVRIDGLDALREMLEETLPNEAHNLTRAAIFQIAKKVALEIQANAPVRTGNLRQSVKAKRLKGDRTTVASDVYFTSGPLVKNDGFYWRFLEHGTQPHSTKSGANASVGGRGRGWRKGGGGGSGSGRTAVRGLQHTPEQPFVGPAVDRLGAAIPKLLREQVGVALEKRLARKAKRAKP